MLKDFSKYTISNIFVKATGFVIPLILAYYYTEAEYGVITLGYAYMNFFLMFFAFGFCESVQRFYYNLRDTNQKDIFGNILLFDFILVFFFSLIFVILCFCTNIFKELPISIFLMVLFIGYMKALQNIGLSFLQMEGQSSKYVSISVASVLFDVVLIILFVVIIHLPIQFRFVSLLICNSFSTFLIIFFIKKYIDKPKQLLNEQFIKVLKFALPCMLLPVMSWLLTTSDKVVMSKLGTMSDVGIYSFCFSIATMPSIINQGFNTAYTPIFYAEYENRSKIKSIQNLFIELYSLMLLIFLLFVNIFFNYVHIFEKYEPGLKYIPFFLISNVFGAISTLNNSHLAYAYKTKITLMITAITGSVSIFLNFLFIKNFDSLGAAISVATVMTIQMILSFGCAIKYGYFAWSLRKLLFMTVFFFAGLFVATKLVILSIIIIIYILYIIIAEKNLIKRFMGRHD